MAEYCGAKSRNGSNCKRPAGWGTNHVGEGKCKLHGGATPIKHGLYSKYTKHSLAQSIDTLLDDPDLVKQVAFKQAIIFDRLNQIGNEMLHEDMRFLADMSEKVSQDIERLNKIEQDEKYVIQVTEVQALIQQITIIMHQEVTDMNVIERVADRLQQLKW